MCVCVCVFVVMGVSGTVLYRGKLFGGTRVMYPGMYVCRYVGI